MKIMDDSDSSWDSDSWIEINQSKYSASRKYDYLSPTEFHASTLEQIQLQLSWAHKSQKIIPKSKKYSHNSSLKSLKDLKHSIATKEK